MRGVEREGRNGVENTTQTNKHQTPINRFQPSEVFVPDAEPDVRLELIAWSPRVFMCVGRVIRAPAPPRRRRHARELELYCRAAVESYQRRPQCILLCSPTPPTRRQQPLTKTPHAHTHNRLHNIITDAEIEHMLKLVRLCGSRVLVGHSACVAAASDTPQHTTPPTSLPDLKHNKAAPRMRPSMVADSETGAMKLSTCVRDVCVS